MKTKKITIILPAYNAERTLEKTYKGIPKKPWISILLVDDGSKDGTSLLSKKLGIKTVTHKMNMGYGANQKTCYKHALKDGVDYVIMLHPDGQYDPKDLKHFFNALKDGDRDVILGSRFLSGKDQTPFYKSFSIKIITLLFNLVLRTRLSEVNTGYRCYSRTVLEKIPFHKNGDGYIFDPQFIIQIIRFGFKIHDVPVSKMYNPEAISPNFRKSVHHGIENIMLLLQYILHKSNIKKADFLTS